MAHWLVKSEPSVWSWDQQVKAGAKGIKYEDFLAQGGRRVDLAWDLVHDNVVVL